MDKANDMMNSSKELLREAEKAMALAWGTICQVGLKSRAVEARCQMFTAQVVEAATKGSTLAACDLRARRWAAYFCHFECDIPCEITVVGGT